MNQGKPVFLKTYGKQRHRKMDAWISPGIRKKKHLFSSTTLSCSNDSISDSKVTKTRVRLAKSKAMECLKVKVKDDSDEEDVFAPLPLRPTQQNNKQVRSGRVVRRRGQRDQVLSTSESETESSPVDENNSPKRRKVLARGKKSVAAPPTVGRFVTRRKGAATSRPKPARATRTKLVPFHINSSEEFIPGRGGSTARCIPKPPKRKAAPLVFSSVENSVSEVGNASSTSNLFLRDISLRDISLVESAHHSLGPCPRKPLFCSTPSARRSRKRPRLEMHPVKHRPSSPGDPFPPPDSAPLGELAFGEKLSTLGELQKEPGEGQSCDSVAKRGDGSRRSICSVGRHHQNEGTEIQSGHNQERFTLVCSDLPSNSRTGEEPEDNTGFVSAEEGLEWLVGVLKEKCLTQQCTVKLKRVVKLTASQLLGLTTYSSCLDDTCAVHSPLTADRSTSVEGGQIPDHSVVLIHSQTLSSVQIIDGEEDSFHLELQADSVQTINHSQTADSSQSVNDCESINHARPVTDLSQSVDCYQSVDHTASRGLSNDQSKSVVCVESDHHIMNIDGSEENSHCTDHSQSAGLGTEERAPSLTAMPKEICLSKESPTVQLRRMTLLQLNITQQLGEITQSRRSGLVSDGQSVNCTEPADKSEVDQTVNIDHLDSCTRSNNIDKRKRGLVYSEGKSPQGEFEEILTTDVPSNFPPRTKAADTQSIDNSRFIDLTDNALKDALKNCLTKKSIVQVKRMSLSGLTQRLKETTLLSSPHDPSSASEGQSLNSTWSGSEPESDPPANPDHPSGLRSSRNIDKKNGSLSDHDHKTTSEAKEKVSIPGHVLPKEKKASLSPKGKQRRSVSRGHPETTRKASLSPKGKQRRSVSRDCPGTTRKPSLAPKGKRRRSVSRDRPGTTRKACVKGLSVSRWKDKSNTSTHAFQSRAALRGGSKAGDCSITELLSSSHNKPMVSMGSLLQGSAVIFSTPVQGRISQRLNISSLLADISPSKHTWSRLKAALSVHRKTRVFMTPKRLPPHVLDSPGGACLIDTSQDLFTTPIRKSLTRSRKSQLVQNASLSVCEDDELLDAEKVYAECGQEGLLSWEECILPQQMKRCKKIGEGTFGEVFSTTNASGETVALKIIPVEGDDKVNGEDQKTFGEILHEIIISKELSSLKDKQRNQTHGFIGLNDLHCVRGCYPPALLKAWDAFDRQKGSENDRPDFFEEEQLFLIMEFEFGGSDLENSNGMLASLMTAKTILHQVTAAMAVAEQALRFEHRDLHWGNVLVKKTRDKKVSFLLNGSNHSLETKGVHVRIIDYSLSRLEIDELTVSCDISEDEELFMGQGDYQFDIYRLMRRENSNNWADYQPHSNVLWLHYLSCKLLGMKYRGAVKHVREELTCFHDNVLQYRSATEVLQNALLFK